MNKDKNEIVSLDDLYDLIFPDSRPQTKEERTSTNKFFLSHFKTKTNMKIKIYKDAKKEWRWQMKSTNGRIIADSGEGYKKFHNCFKMAAMFAEKFGAKMI